MFSLRRTTLTTALVVLLGVASACSSAAARSRSGIAGRVLIGPVCPVERQGQTCTRPYQGALVLLSAAHHRRIAAIRTDHNGRFRVRAAPGRYLLERAPASNRSGPRSGPATAVRVRAHHFTAVSITFDTGIR